MAHPKSVLADRLNKQDFGSPAYSTTGAGPEHDQVFTSEVSARGQKLGTGSAKTKREAERLAAEAALAWLDRQQEDDKPSRASRTPERSARSGRGNRNQARAATRADEPAEAADEDGAEGLAGEQPADHGNGAAFHDEDDGEFEGPWPVFEAILNQSLQIAQSRVPPNLTGDEARVAISAFTLDLYKELLQNLGEVVEVDDD